MESYSLSNSFCYIAKTFDFENKKKEEAYDFSEPEDPFECDFTVVENSSYEEDSSEDDFTFIEDSPEHDLPKEKPIASNYLQDLYQTGKLYLKEAIYIPKVSSIIPHTQIPSSYQHSVKKLIESPSTRIGSQQVYDLICKMKLSKNINVKWEALMEALFENISIDRRRPSYLIQDYIDSKNDSLNANIIFIPFIFKSNSYLRSLFNSAHIVLITIDIDNKTIEYYDSLAYAPEYWVCYNKFCMREDLDIIKNTCFKNDPKAKIINNSLKQQYDCHSCGIYVLSYMKERLEGRSFEEITNQIMNSQDIQRIRIELACLLSEPEEADRKSS